ncbi:hypothetical protein H8356DRAFT_1381564 [Neocallimastix lanati (nom. inval.)]|nr:hypothetical protein H8356DRAFT_1381564 [Neocallimastix sp. JGI-2020a]
MSDSDILKQIALLNPRIINGNEVDANDFIMQSDTSSPIEENTGPQIMENDDDDILNLWSSTKIFFDPFDPSKINSTTQSQNNINIPSSSFDSNNNTNNEIIQLTEREIDRQRYTRLKQQKQRVYAQRGRRSKNSGNEGNSNGNGNTLNTEENNIFNKNNILNLNEIQQYLLNEEKNSKKNNGLLQVSSSNMNITPPSMTTTPNFSLSTHLNNNTKLNNANSIDFNLPLDKSIINGNEDDASKKNKDLYSQLLNSMGSSNTSPPPPPKVKSGKREMKVVDSTTILSKVNDRSKEIAEKKKRRSAATMRCRERKKNQLQKKEQYIKYLENQILFLNGSILHMSNEITWLRRSFLDQYGEQSLKNIYLKNGFKNVNFDSVMYSGSSPFSPSTFTNTSMLSPDLTLSPGSGQEQNQDHNQGSDQDSSFLTPASPSSLKNISSTSTTDTVTTTTKKRSTKTTATDSIVIGDDDDTHGSSTTRRRENHSHFMAGATPTSTNSNTGVRSHRSGQEDNSNSGFLRTYQPTPTSTLDQSSPSVSSLDNVETLSSQKDLFSQLDMETLNEFTRLSKEQREILLKILERQQIGNTKDNPAPPPPQRNYINIAANDEEVNGGNSRMISKPSSSLLNFDPASTAANTNQFNSLSPNLLQSLNQQDLQTISFRSSSMTLPSSSAVSGPSSSVTTTTKDQIFLTPSSHTANTNSLNLTTSSDLLTSLNAQNNLQNSNPVSSTISKDSTTSGIPTSTNTQDSEYINLENLIYYI